MAMPDPRLGERACAFVVRAADVPRPRRGAASTSTSSSVARQYWPERIEPDRRRCPATPVGKIQKFVLRELAAGLKPIHREGAVR